jgi:hypothetical protein
VLESPIVASAAHVDRWTIARMDLDTEEHKNDNGTSNIEKRPVQELSAFGRLPLDVIRK